MWTAPSWLTKVIATLVGARHIDSLIDLEEVGAQGYIWQQIIGTNFGATTVFADLATTLMKMTTRVMYLQAESLFARVKW